MFTLELSHVHVGSFPRSLQTRFHLPVWLGVDTALGSAAAGGKLELLQEMYDNWIFFRVGCVQACRLCTALLMGSLVRYGDVYYNALPSAYCHAG